PDGASYQERNRIECGESGATEEVTALHNGNRVTRKNWMSMSSKPKINVNKGRQATSTQAEETSRSLIRKSRICTGGGSEVCYAKTQPCSTGPLRPAASSALSGPAPMGGPVFRAFL